MHEQRVCVVVQCSSAVCTSSVCIRSAVMTAVLTCAAAAGAAGVLVTAQDASAVSAGVVVTAVGAALSVALRALPHLLCRRWVLHLVSSLLSSSRPPALAPPVVHPDALSASVSAALGAVELLAVALPCDASALRGSVCYSSWRSYCNCCWWSRSCLCCCRRRWCCLGCYSHWRWSLHIDRGLAVAAASKESPIDLLGHALAVAEVDSAGRSTAQAAAAVAPHAVAIWCHLCWDAIAACASDRASSLYLHLAVEVVAALRCDAQVCGRAVDELPRQRPPAVATPTLFC
jgi:hypothetical protein